MSEPQQEDAMRVGESDNETNYLVVDPDDYQKTKKLEAIHKTKKQVLDVRDKRMELIREYHDEFTKSKGLDVYQHRLAQTVAQYGSELLPLIEEGLDKAILEEEDLEVKISPSHSECDLLYYIEMDGRIRHDDEIKTAPETNSIAMYRQLDRIQRKLGLGLEIEEQKGPAEI